MYLFASKIKIKMKWQFCTFNHKILYHTILIACRNKESDHKNCKIITIEGEEKVFGWDVQIVSNALKIKTN
jgi:hypothetical protein